MKWQFYFLRNALIGLVPFSGVLGNIKRNCLPCSAAIDINTLSQGVRQVNMLRSTGCSINGKVVLEIGTGSHPVIPMIFLLCECSKIILMDKQRLLSRPSLLGTIAGIKSHGHTLSQTLGLPVSLIEDLLSVDTPESLDALLHRVNMEYHAPRDFLETALRDKSVDIIISRAVLEHVPPSMVGPMCRVCGRILKDDGKMCHIIDNSDHMQHVDKSISRLNFLRFSDETFKWLSSFHPRNYQNRLRHSEYVAFLEQSGFKIDLDESEVDGKALNDLRGIDICRRYRDFPREDLARLTSYIVASKL